MNTTFDARTDPLSIDDAKKLWRDLSKSGREHAFEEMGCSGGADVEIKHDGLGKEDLDTLNLPESCYDFHIDTASYPFCENGYRVEKLPDDIRAFFLGGPDYPVPDYGWVSDVRFLLVPKGLNVPISFSYSLDNTMKVYGRTYGLCHEVEAMCFPDDVKGFARDVLESPLPPDNRIREVLLDIWKRFGIPWETSEGNFEQRDTPIGRTSYLDPDHFGWGWAEFENMIRTLAVESPVKTVLTSSTANPGGGYSPSSLKEDAEKLALMIGETCPYETYDIRYNAMMAMSWAKREKLRKKWKKPILHEVGMMTFKNGGEAEVKILIEKEGYVFVLEFSVIESVESFSKSKLFAKARWEIQQ